MTVDELVENHIDLVYYVYNTAIGKTSLVKRYEEDIIAEGKIGLWRAALKYNPLIGEPSSLFYIAIKRKMLLKIVRLKRETCHEISIQTPIKTNRDGSLVFIEDTLVYEEDYDSIGFKVGDIIKPLSEKEKSIINLRICENKSYREIGEKYNISKQRVEQIYSRSLKKLRKILKKGT